MDIPVQVPDSAGEGQLEATVLGPDQMSVPSTVTKESDGYHIRFVPRQTGQHKVMVMYGGKEVSGSPYAVRIRDATNKKVKVKEMEQMRTGYSTQKEVRGERMRIVWSAITSNSSHDGDSDNARNQWFDWLSDKEESCCTCGTLFGAIF